jgi:hypothetical protein
MRRAGLLLLLAAAACAQVTQPPAPPPPPDLVAGAAEPTRAAMAAIAAAFVDRGEHLAGRPAEAAQAAAQLEFVVADLPRNPRWAAMPDSIRLELLLARTELRDALGVAEAAAPDAVIEALLRAARALRAGDRRAAAAALPAPLFRPGGARSVDRLGDLGPLPQVANATALAAQMAEQLGIGGGLSSTQFPERTGGIGSITTPGIPAGY